MKMCSINSREKFKNVKTEYLNDFWLFSDRLNVESISDKKTH